MRLHEMPAEGHCLLFVMRISICALLFLTSIPYFTLIILYPSFHIHNFYVPALNKFTNSTTTSDTIVFFDLEIQNNMINAGVRYNAVNLTFSYSNMALGTYKVPGFYQGMNKKAHRREVVEVTSRLPWKEAATGAISSGSTTEFRVDLATDVKFKNYFWYFKDKRVTAEGVVGVDDSGKKVGMESVELKTGEPIPSILLILLWFVGFLLLFVACVAIPFCGIGALLSLCAPGRRVVLS